MKFNPKVSIIIPVYNGSKYVAEAIDSALAQTYSNIEIIIVNDGSCDNGATENVILSYRDKVRYFTKSNGGVATALNMGIKNMTGSYFSWLSHDDLYYPEKIENQVNYLKVINDRKTIIYSDYEVFSDDPMDTTPFHMCGVPPEKFRYWITVANGLHGCTLLIPKSAFDECGLFDENLKTTQDYDLWFRIAEKYDFICKKEILVKARSHPEQCTHKLQECALQECDDLLTKFVNELKRSELIVSTNKTPKLTYADIAVNMKSRGFKGASQAAKTLEKSLHAFDFHSSIPDEYAILKEKYDYLNSLLIIKISKYFYILYRNNINFAKKITKKIKSL